MSLLRELKRRNVIRMAGLYLVAAWLLTQVASTLLPAFDVPSWALRGLVIVLALGFVPALIVAWVFELTPQGLRRDDEVRPEESIAPQTARRMDRMIIVVLSIALVYFGFDKFVLAPRREAAIAASVQKPDGSPGVVKAGDAPSDRSIAVLPFENLSADKDNEYFASGMQDMILTKLADIRELRVISRTSTEKYKSHPDNLKTIARELGVARIVEGSVQKAGNQVLINVQLIDVATDQHLWAQAYTRTLENIFGVEGEVAAMIAEALKARLTPGEVAAVQKLPTQNKDAYDAYLKSRYFLANANRTADRGELERSIEQARRAVELDPGFVEAYGALALAYIKLGGHNAEGEAAIRHVLALDPDDADAHRILALALKYRGELREAEVEAREAVRLRPDLVYTHAAVGFVYYAAGRFEDAAAEFRRAIAIEPRGNYSVIGLAHAQASERRYAEARDTLHSAVARDPADVLAATRLARVHVLGWGDLDAARGALQAVPTSVASSGALCVAWFEYYLYARDYAAALRAIDQTPPEWFANEHVPCDFFHARAYQAQGDTARARAAFAAARTELEAWVEAAPEDAESVDPRANLALSLAGVGAGEAASREAQRAITLMPLEKDAEGGPERLAVLAEVNARAGNTDAAVKLLSQLLTMPAGATISVPLLRLDPAWDPIRVDPRFEALLKKYANVEPLKAGRGAAHD